MFSDLKVLIVDDEPAIRKLLVRWLRHWNCSVTCVASAQEAIAHLERHPADVMFADIFMPIRDGLSLLVEVRSRWPDLMVVMESGDSAMSTVALTRDYGAVAFLPKPYGREEVRQAMERAMSRLSIV